MNQVKLAIFASGRGSNAESIIRYFEHNTAIEAALIVSNKPDAGVLQLAERHHIPSLILSRPSFYQSENLIEDLKKYDITHLVLAGFLWKIPEYLIHAYPDRIVNIHPALLPKYGGKGMYGHHVHQAVFDNKEKESGMTIHLVNENYDEGRILFQASIPISPEDRPEDIASKVLVLEHRYYPVVIEEWVSGKSSDGSI